MDSVFPYGDQKLLPNDRTTYNLPAIHLLPPNVCLVPVGLVRICYPTGLRQVNKDSVFIDTVSHMSRSTV